LVIVAFGQSGTNAPGTPPKNDMAPVVPSIQLCVVSSGVAQAKV
jgi:hypothetical protein